MTDVSKAVERYFQAWNIDDPSERVRVVSAAWSDDASYSDPMSAADGPDAIAEMIGAVRAQFPGALFVRASGIDEHHGRIRFAWAMRQQDGTVAVSGIDVGELAPDGRLRQIVGFFGEPQPLEAASA